MNIAVIGGILALMVEQGKKRRFRGPCDHRRSQVDELLHPIGSRRGVNDDSDNYCNSNRGSNRSEKADKDSEIRFPA